MKHLDEAAKEAAFERCMDFLARMIEKYGPEIVFPDQESKQCENDSEDAKASPLLFWHTICRSIIRKQLSRSEDIGDVKVSPLFCIYMNIWDNRILMYFSIVFHFILTALF